MGLIVCQLCHQKMDFFDGAKVTVLYAVCSSCNQKKKNKKAIC